MKLESIIGFMNEYAPETTAYEWDNVGLLLGDESVEINKILLCLDVTNSVVEEAIEKNINLIISHHPFIFRPINSIVKSNPLGNKIIKLIQNNINVYSSHTNLDLANEGTNDTLFDLLELKDKIALQKEDENSLSLGRVGELRNQMEFEKFVQFVKEKLNLKNITYVKSNNRLISRVGIGTGACGSMNFFIDAIKNNCDVYITSDMKHHDAIDANELGLNIIDGTHHATEIIIVNTLYEKINDFIKNNKYENIEIIKSETNKPIFDVL